MTSASDNPASGFAAKRVTASVAVQAWALSASATVGSVGAAAAAPTLPTVAEAESAHAWTATDAVTRFAAKPDAGLSEAEVTRRREVAGRNVLVQAAKRTQWQMLLDQFDDRLVQILVRSRRPVV